MVPLRSIAELRIVLGPQVISRYNNYRSDHDQRRARRRACPRATRWRRWQQISAQHAAAGLCLRMDRHRVSGTAGGRPDRARSSALAVLFAYLFLVALYESWMIPIPVLLSVAVGVLGAFVGL